MIKTIFLILLALVIFAIGVIIYDMTHVKVVRYTIESEKIQKDTRLCLLSDLHNHHIGKNNEKLLQAIEECAPDGLLVSGDLVTAQKGCSYSHAIPLLRQLREKYPIYYGYGNHESKLRERTDYYGDFFEKYRSELESLGLSLMQNERKLLEEANIEVVGYEIPLFYFKHFNKNKPDKEAIEAAVGKADASHFELLIAHQPEFFESYDAWGADLTVSGHQHGGIVRLPFLGGVISTGYQLFPHYDGGFYEGVYGKMIISRGLGTHTIPVRFYNPCELVVIDFKTQGRETEE